MDPGNWGTDIEAGSTFRYSLLYIIFLSNAMAMVLQYLSLRLGILSGLDLAQACALRSPRWLRWTLYVFAETAMIATDLAEVIGTAIALQLLFNCPLWIGVLVTSLDVLLILSGLVDPSVDHEDTNPQSEKAKRAKRNARIIEWIIMVLMTTVGICFILEWQLVQPSFSGVMRGFFTPNVALLFEDRRALFVALGIIGATVMPHNLYLHSYLVQARIRLDLVNNDDDDDDDGNGRGRGLDLGSNEKESGYHSPDMEKGELRLNGSSAALPAVPGETAASFSTYGANPFDMASPRARSTSISQAAQSELVEMEPKLSRSLQKHPNIQPLAKASRRLEFIRHLSSNVHFATIDSTVALTFALFINSSILITAAAGLHEHGAHAVKSIQDAALLLEKFLGRFASILFGLALLACGQSSTLTGTLAAQVVFEGFLKIRIRRVWLRRLFTRGIAILPAIVVVTVVGEAGLSELLIISQVVLSFQLPFAIVPLIYYNVDSTVMNWRWSRRERARGSQTGVCGLSKPLVGRSGLETAGLEGASRSEVEGETDPEAETEFETAVKSLTRLPRWLLVVSILIATLIIGMGLTYLVVTLVGE